MRKKRRRERYGPKDGDTKQMIPVEFQRTFPLAGFGYNVG
jgi:hypothetical protein